MLLYGDMVVNETAPNKPGCSNFLSHLAVGKENKEPSTSMHTQMSFR